MVYSQTRNKVELPLKFKHISFNDASCWKTKKNVDDEKVTFIRRLIWMDLGQSCEDPCKMIDRIGYEKKHWIFPASNTQSNRWECHKFNKIKDIVALHSQSESRSLVESATFRTRNFLYAWWSGLSNWQFVKKYRENNINAKSTKEGKEKEQRSKKKK